MYVQKWKLIFGLWCLKLIFLRIYFYAGVFCEEMKIDVEIDADVIDIKLDYAMLLSYLEIDKSRFIVAVDFYGTLHLLNSNIKSDSTVRTWKEDLGIMKGIVTVPKGAFDFPAILISSGNIKSENSGDIIIIDVSNFEGDPATYTISNDESETGFRDYFLPIWLSNSEFIIARRHKIEKQDPHSKLMYFKSTEKKTEPWQGQQIGEVEPTEIIYYKEIWNNFDAFYTITIKKSLTVFWLENDMGEPGNWTDANDLKTQDFKRDNAYFNLEFVDVTFDGKVELLTSRAFHNYAMITAFEIPLSGKFKDAMSYKPHDLFTFREKECDPELFKTFSPNSSYTGMPWIVITCSLQQNVYLITPTSDPNSLWSYDSHLLHKELVSGLEAADIDGDGITELFLSLLISSEIKIINIKNLPEKTTITQIRGRNGPTEAPGDSRRFTSGFFQLRTDLKIFWALIVFPVHL